MGVEQPRLNLVMNMPHDHYRSYILRIWQERPQVVWHATVQCIQTDEITHFADLELLYSFLTAQTTRAQAPGTTHLRGMHSTADAEFYEE